MSASGESEPRVHLAMAGSVATLWLDHPRKRNAMTHSMWLQFAQHCEDLSERGDVRAVVVRGAEGHFCAGADITGLGDVSPDEYRRVNLAAESALAELAVPTIAFVTGSCVGGGVEIAVACDLRIAGDDARFGVTPARLGIVYPAPALERLVNLIGPSASKHLLFSAELIDAERAQRIGLVDEVHPQKEAEERLANFVELLAGRRSLLTQVAAKEMVDAVVREGSVDSELEQRWSAEMEAAGDPVEGVVAFMERRDPDFDWTPRQDRAGGDRPEL